MEESAHFKEKGKSEIGEMAQDENLKKLSMDWMNAANSKKYSYHFEWLGQPIIQYPQDMLAMQEIIWNLKPDLIIETGIARGGSLIYYASLMELLETTNVSIGGRVIGIDNDIRKHNRSAIESHPLFRRIDLIEGSSVNSSTKDRVFEKIGKANNVLVVLDSFHTHKHVLLEMEMYQSFVSDKSYLVVFDTVIEFMRPDMFDDRPWGVGDNPMTAVYEFLKTNKNFKIDEEIHNKLQISVAPNGYLKCSRT
jgi:cephalosporin hydroxylase